LDEKRLLDTLVNTIYKINERLKRDTRVFPIRSLMTEEVSIGQSRKQRRLM